MQHKDNWKHESTLVKKNRCVVSNSGTKSRIQHNRLWSAKTRNEICMSKSIDSKIKFWTKVGFKLPTLPQNQVTQNEVALSSLVTSDLCQTYWILNESTNRQETRRGCDSQDTRNKVGYQSAQSCQKVEYTHSTLSLLVTQNKSSTHLKCGGT